ncbi:hypothetical protein BT93_J0284 [Corymbia citriodora subsp. variegata]|nr:hypothetical protein BT93_J0284 [Corymbia citriodora subsp. variegata]
MSSWSTRSSRRKTPTTSSLPHDLLRNVLSRLPTISLLKLRSVCREWRDIIDHPHFAAMHAASSAESPRIVLLSEPSSDAEPPRFMVDDEFLVTSLPELAARPWVNAAGASCHGLFCFQDIRDGTTYLLNPLTQEIVPLPSFDRLGEGWYLFTIGIGASRLTSQYKIVRLSCLNETAAPSYRADVLDQGSRSWRNIASVPSGIFLRDPVFVAGSIHWRDLRGDGVVRITSFDVAEEEFTPTPCPELQDAHLVDLQGALGLVDCSREERMDVWVMEEESGRWTKEYSVRLIPPMPKGTHWCLDVRGCGGRKMVLSCMDSFWFYDLATGERKYVHKAGAWPARAIRSITVSLLSPAKLWNSGGQENVF